jgi:hypothetical protein
MTPGELKIPISKGAKWSFAFRLVVKGTNTPIDLTGLGPFICEVKAFNADRLLATPTIESDYGPTGVITITMEAAVTATLPLGKVRMGVKDTEDNPYMEGNPEVVWFTPNV